MYSLKPPQAPLPQPQPETPRRLSALFIGLLFGREQTDDLRRRHIAAAITGYITWACLVLLIVVNLYNLVAAWRGGGPGFSSEMPFERSYAVRESQLIVNVQSARGINGDGATYMVWRLSGSPKDLRKLVTNEVSDSRVWFHRPFDERDQKAMEFVSSEPEYAKAAPYTDQVKSGDFYFSYQQLCVYDDGRVGDAGIYFPLTRCWSCI